LAPMLMLNRPSFTNASMTRTSVEHGVGVGSPTLFHPDATTGVSGHRGTSL